MLNAKCMTSKDILCNSILKQNQYHGRCDVIRMSDPLERYGLCHQLLALGVHTQDLFVRLGHHGPWRDRINPNLRGQLKRERLGHVVHARFRSGVGPGER